MRKRLLVLIVNVSHELMEAEDWGDGTKVVAGMRPAG